MTNKEKEKESSKFWEETFDFVKTLLITMALVFTIAHYVVRPVKVQGSSMYPTLESDALGVSNALGYRVHGIERFDVVIIYMPEKKEYLVKRVIGMPNETISYQDGNLYIDGVLTEEPFLSEEYTSLYPDGFTQDVSEVTLGDDEYYCLGDNRPNSRDSRYYGAFSSDQIIAKGVVILWPLNQIGVRTW